MNELRSLYLALEKKVAHLSNRLALSHRILTAIEEGILFLTEEGVVSLLNPAMERLLKLAPQEGVERVFWELFDDALFGFSMQAALNNKHNQRALLTIEGREVEISAIFSQGMIVVARDRTEVRQLEKSVERKARLHELGEMAATLAHEIRNPLGGIEGFASLLAHDLKEASHQAMVSSIIEGTRTLNALVTEVLNYTREVKLTLVQCDLVAIAHETAALAGKACSVEAPAQEVIVAADRERLKLALLNLVRNGIEAADRVKIVVKKEKIVEIVDEGEGMSAEVQEKLFTPFFTTKTHGTGLGLVETQKVIQAHGWRLEVESQEGLGTTFRVKR